MQDSFSGSSTRRFAARVAALTLVFAVFASSAARGAKQYLERATPESQGVPSEAVKKFLDESILLPDGAECHGLMVLRHGKVIGEAYPLPFSPDYAQTLYSCSKTFTAAAVGLAVDRNLLRVTDRVGAILPDYLPQLVSQNLADLTVADLLTMASGITPDWTMRNKSRKWGQTFLAKPIGQPGREFAYDSMDTYLLSAIVQRLTGRTVLEYLNEHIFGPMGIDEVQWEISPEGVNTGGWGLYVRPEVMAAFGQLLLDKGRYGERQLLSEKWVNEMMTPHRRANAAENYGYQMWECEHDGAWRADGAFGQYIVIVPQEDFVVVLTQASSRGAGKSLAPIWNTLLPAARAEALPESPAATELAEHQKKYRFEPAAGARTHRNGSALQGQTYILPHNDLEWSHLSFKFEPERLILGVTTTGGQKYDIDCGNQRWLTVNTPVPPPYSIKAVDRFRGIDRNFAVSGSYGWLPDGTLTVHILYPSWISGVYLTFNPKVRTMTVKQNTIAKPYTMRVDTVRKPAAKAKK